MRLNETSDFICHLKSGGKNSVEIEERVRTELEFVECSVEPHSGLLDIELTEDHIGGLGHFLGISREADLTLVLGHERHAVLLQLLEGLRLTLGPPALPCATLDQRLQAEFDSDGH